MADRSCRERDVEVSATGLFAAFNVGCEGVQVMIGTQDGWEQPLFRLAMEGCSTLPRSVPAPDGAPLDGAYDFCRALIARHSRSFYLSALLLPRHKRRAMYALYAFCRVSDDIVDCREAGAQAALEAWRECSLAVAPPRSELVATAWADVRRRFGVPTCYAEQLLDGVAQDLQPSSYRTFAELAAYAYGVASTVGLMSMYIVGFQSWEAIPYAIRLGIALQLTNILRDVGEDWRAGRVYLPQQELAAFGLTRADLARGAVDERWRNLMRFQLARNRRLYEEAWPGIGLLHPDGRPAIAASAALYRAILDDIEAHDYDVFSRRAHVSTARKVVLLARAWAAVRRPGRGTDVADV